MLDFGGMEGMEGMEGWGWRKTGWMEGPRVEVEMSQELGVRVSEQNSWAASRSVVRCDRHISFDQGWCALQVVLYSRSARNGNGMTFSRWLLHQPSTSLTTKAVSSRVPTQFVRFLLFAISLCVFLRLVSCKPSSFARSFHCCAWEIFGGQAALRVIAVDKKPFGEMLKFTLSVQNHLEDRRHVVSHRYAL